MPLFLTEAEVTQLATLDMALDAVRTSHRALALGHAVDVARQRSRLPAAALHILQGALPDEGVFGYKAYATGKSGAHFRVYLFSAADAAPLAVLEADRLGMLRTGAAGGVAADVLARPAAARVGLFGSGWQAQSQLEALCAVRKISEVKVWSRDAVRRAAFCAEQSARLGVRIIAASDAQDCVAEADLIVTITSSPKPLFEAAWVRAGAHINAAGSNALIRRELDEATVQRAAVVCVDSRATARREAGDLLPLLEKGRLLERQLVELGELLTGQQRGRSKDTDITLFESQGLAIQDLALAKRVVDKARQQGIGRELP